MFTSSSVEAPLCPEVFPHIVQPEASVGTILHIYIALVEEEVQGSRTLDAAEKEFCNSRSF